MRFINLIVVHCSATRCDRCYTEHDLTTDHLRRGFSGAGYHFYIRKNGDIKSLHPLSLPGAHVRGWNAGSIGVCYEGGLDECGRPALSPDLNHNGEIEPEEWVKQCPCFDAATILTEPPPPNPACL